MPKGFFLFFFSLIQLFSTCFAQNAVLEFSQNLTISDGLAHNGVTSILEDSKGYLWIGTYDGINRYDGYEFVTYKNTIEKELLVSNRVRSLAEDKSGNIWIGTDQGISIYNYKYERFDKLYSITDINQDGPIIRRVIISKDKANILCLTEGDGILVFDANYKLVNHIQPEDTYGVDVYTFFDGIELDASNFIFTTSVGLVSYDFRTEKFKLEIEHERGMSNASVEIKGKIILATRQRGLSIVKVDTRAGKYIYKLKSIQFEDKQFNSVSIDENDNVWLGTTFEGIIHVKNIKAFVAGKDVEKKYFANSSKILRTSSIVANTSNGCWVTTFNKGIYRFDIKENPFKKYIAGLDADKGLRSSSVSHIAAWGKDKVFISAVRGGFALFNTRTGEFEDIPFNIPSNAGNIASVFVDSRKDIWMKILGNYGLCRVRNGSHKIEIIDQRKFPLARTIRPRTITEDQYGHIWVGDEAGVYKISVGDNKEVLAIEELNNNPFFKQNPLSLVRCVYTDPLHNYIWIGTDSDGLIRLSNDENIPVVDLKLKRSIRNKNKDLSISSNFVSTIVRLPNNDLWIGTERGGICKVLNAESEPEFISFTEKNGLSNNVVKRIFYDSEYNLWVATNIGLNKFFTKDNHFRSFSKANGLPFEDFWYSFAKLSNGYVVLSGIDGLCYFKPEKVSDIEKLPPLEFTNFKIFNESVAPGDTIGKRVILDERLNDLRAIELKYDENVFSLELNSLHYSKADNHYLRYQLLPVNEEWIEVPSNQKVISFNGLRHGKYTFRAMASNSLHEWTEPKELSINISPPYWKTTQAYFFYVIFATLVIYIVIFFVLKIQSLRHNLQIEHMEKETVKEVNAAKLRFFSNISHEIKTPLTLITGPVNILADRFKGNVDVKEKLSIVQRQSKKISQLIDQVHDFQRSDANLLEMSMNQFCFDDFIKELKTDFDFMALTDKKQLEVEGLASKVYVSADRDKLEKIFNNLLNNAFKYTKENDSITISYHVKGNDLFISVSDSGKGIDGDDLPYIFERFYQSKHKHSEYTGGSGIGLAFSKRLVEMHYGDIDVESALGEGSKFNLRLPIVIEKGEELAEDKLVDILKVEKEADKSEFLAEQFDISSIKVDEEFAETSVFFAEDNTEMRNFVSGVLSNFFKVKTFTNGQECLDALDQEWPDIVISDVLMPELNGFDLCKTLKTDIKTSHIPVVLLTACTTIDDHIQGLELGADAYIRKPFNVQHLVTRTESLLRNRQQLRERYNIDLPLTRQKEDNKASDNAFLEKLYQLMEKNLDNQELDLDGFAKELYLNRTHFFQKVKAITNQTPYELLKSYRVKKAAEFLVQDGLSVNEVFMMTGFKSRAHFNKLFKEKYEVTPGKFATEMNKKYSS